MNVSVFVTMWMTAMSSVTLNDHFLGEPLAFLKTNDQVNSVEFYTPYTGAVPKLDDIPAPHLLIEIKVKSWEGAQTLTAASNFKRLFTEKTGILAGAEKINVEILEAVHYDIPGPQATPARTAPFSFVVRYYGPVANAADFTEFYTRNHPPLLAQFPNIRNVLCYLPRAWNTRTELTDDTLILGNEVVFDNIEDFVAAIESDAMGPVMADGDRFESYGYSSHHAMHRKVVFSR
ncbi:MAG: hypothetical protein OXD47_00730 [Gammaproteobacteria bacterium]|nr:hypothetical protein [Gammaproteobacteria bacterium]MCY4210851.1 hypothetical protein [Gammaproteobacteria bacterium]MCY4282833.1 hypothetical protein [Gammaproteobacteria bacterium]MCY4337307.1 hypothetical protein [Gammaproteobacteria bacterium]